MANPLRYLRKHQKVGLAVLCIVVTITWGIGTAIQQVGQDDTSKSSSRSDSVVVATWKDGNITRSDLKRMGWEHQAVIRFLMAVVERVQDAGAKPQAPFLSIRQDGIDLGLAMRSDDPTLVQIMMFAEKADEFGVQVDQKAMMDYLNNLGGFLLAEADFHELARQTVSQYRDGERGTPLVTVTQLFDRLKVELAALQAKAMFTSGLTGFSTGELWEYHEQLRRRDKIEAYPISVADYKDRIKESDAKEADLKKIYEDGKERVAHPEGHQPGFRQPLRLAFGYVKVDFQKYLDAAKKNISEEMLVAEYEKEIAAGNFRNLKFEVPDATKTEGDKPSTPAGDADKPSGEGDKPPEKPPAEGTKADAPSDAPKAKEPAAESKSCQEEPAQRAAKEDAKDAKEEKNDQPAAADATEKPPEKVADDKAADDKAADDKAAAEKPPEPEFKPLSEVRDQLLNQLASPEARTASDLAVREIMNAVSEYGTKYTRWSEDQKAGSKTGTKDPGELKLKALAEKHGLTVGQTKLADQFAVAATELGEQAAFRGVRGTVPFADGAYYENRPLFAPQEASSISGETTFVYWRTQAEQSVTLPYDQVRKQVVAAWVKERAVEEARKEAEALAAKAAKAPSLKDVLTAEQAKKVVQPLPFSWLTVGGSPLAFGGAPSFSNVSGIPLARDEFMKEVFSLDVGEAGVAINQPHTTVYVVRVVAEEPALDIRREMFLSGLQAGIFGDLVSYARMASQDIVGDVVEELRKEYKLEWKETPRFNTDM